MKPKYDNYLFEYVHAGSRWGITIPASSEEDAHARLNQIQYAKLAGVEVMTIPVQAGPLAQLLCWFRNTWYHT